MKLSFIDSDAQDLNKLRTDDAFIVSITEADRDKYVLTMEDDYESDLLREFIEVQSMVVIVLTRISVPRRW